MTDYLLANYNTANWATSQEAAELRGTAQIRKVLRGTVQIRKVKRGTVQIISNVSV